MGKQGRKEGRKEERKKVNGGGEGNRKDRKIQVREKGRVKGRGQLGQCPPSPSPSLPGVRGCHRAPSACPGGAPRVSSKPSTLLPAGQAGPRPRCAGLQHLTWLR